MEKNGTNATSICLGEQQNNKTAKSTEHSVSSSKDKYVRSHKRIKSKQQQGKAEKAQVENPDVQKKIRVFSTSSQNVSTLLDEPLPSRN